MRTSDYGGSYVPSTINTGSSPTPAGLANCAGAIGGTGTTPYVLQATSYVFWAATGATGGAAVMRDSYTTGFGAGQALWVGGGISSFMAGTSVIDPPPSNNVVGVAYNPITPILFAATYGELYATTTPLATSNIVWYRLTSAAALTGSRANNFRGLAMAPKQCLAPAPSLPFRQLLEKGNSTAAAGGEKALPLFL